MSFREAAGDEIVALVIDDRASSRKTRMKLLAANGFTVIGAESVDGAIRTIKNTSVDIVVTDINLDPHEPRDKGGIELARRIRALDFKVPVVGYSAAFSEDQLTPEELRTFDKILAKGSARPHELLQHVSDWRALAASCRALRRTRSPDYLNLLRLGDPGLMLFSVNTWLAYNIGQRFFGGQHFAWCTPDFATDSKPSYEASVPPSSCPREVYRLLREAVRLGDRHSDKIKATAAGILHGADVRKAAGEITVDQHKTIKEIVKHAQIADFRPLLYIIRRDLVEHMLVPVPVDQKAAPLAPEFIIERLPWYFFMVIELY